MSPMAETQLEPDELETLISGQSLPIEFDFNTLNRCNVSCVMCPPAIRIAQGTPRAPYYRLTVEEFRQLTAGLPLKLAHFVGAYAEPLLNKEIFDLVREANLMGAKTAITTNGVLLTREVSARLIDAGLTSMTVSLHGATAAIAERIMKGADFNRVIENLLALRLEKDARQIHHPTLMLNYVGMLDNIDDFPELVRRGDELGIEYLTLVHLIDGSKLVDSSQNLVHHPAKLAAAVEKARQYAKDQHFELYVSAAYQQAIDMLDVQ